LEKHLNNSILFVINPTSGTGFGTDYNSVIQKYSNTYNFSFHIYTTTGKKDGEEVKKRINDFKPDIVVAVGGDGTINLVAGLLISSHIKLGIIPTGSANGLAFNLNIPVNFERALKINLENEYRPFDVIHINKKFYCLHLSDIGLNARIVKRFAKEKSKGLIGYGKQLFKELFSPKSYFSFQLKTDEIKKKKKAEMLVIANAHSYGTGVKINPTGLYADGKFELVIIKPYPWWFVFMFIIAGFTGKLHKMEYVDVIRTTKAEITLPVAQDFQVDGEIKNKTKKLEIEILKNALQVVHG